MKLRLACVLHNTRYFALLSRKWQYFILKGQETGTEHVVIATSNCIPSGIFLRVQDTCQVSIELLQYWRRNSLFCVTSPMTSSVTKFA